MIDLDKAFADRSMPDSLGSKPSAEEESKASVAKEIRRAAMNLLARREHARRELELKLAKRFSEDPEILTIELDKLTDEGLQSDARLAEAFVRARVNKGQGPNKIKAELRGKGVSDENYRAALELLDVDWFASVQTLSEKKFGMQAPADAKERMKRSRFLQQRGFSFEHINSLG